MIQCLNWPLMITMFLVTMFFPHNATVFYQVTLFSVSFICKSFLPPKLVAMAREKEDLSLHDTHYRRDFVTYDNQLLDGELFLQVRFPISK